MHVSARISIGLWLAGVCAGTALSQNRPPAIPLITHNPYFSIWSNMEKLTGSPTRHWTGHPGPLMGLVRVDGKSYRIMGTEPGDVPVMEQRSMVLTPTHTRYRLESAGVQVELTFFTPALLDDLDVLSWPVTYVTWRAQSKDGAVHYVAVFFDAGADLATSYLGQA